MLAWGYVAVTLGYLAAAGWYAWTLAGMGREPAAQWLARATWAVHTALLGGHVAAGRVPFLTAHESVFFLSWAWVFNGLVLEALLPLRHLGAFMLPPVVALLVLVAAATGAAAGHGVGAAAGAAAVGGAGTDGLAGTWPGGVPGSLPQPAGAVAAGALFPDNPWVWLHAVIALLSYCAFGLASAVAAMYLLQEHQLRSKIFSRLYRHLPALEDVDRACWWLVGTGFALLTLALASGGLPAGQLWGSQWVRDGKVIASLGVWAFYAVLLTLRALAGWRGRRLAYLSLVGFAVILFNYLVVGPHWSARHVF
ncbi:cytochrome C assembly family protein [Thermaerobacter marianensis]|nr:cytochrome c biogenesis protein CcsA [Thermaerobacter marianensis]